jgi:O-antigen/teichoic acid export membrane protein
MTDVISLADSNKRERLSQRVIRATSWTMLGFVSSQVLRMGGNLVVTRLLVPEMFGVMALFSSIVVVIFLLADVGIRQACVQSPNGDRPEMLHTAWSIQIIRGFILWAVCALIGVALWVMNEFGAFPPNSVYASPELPVVLIVASLGLIIQGLSSTKAFTAERHLDQKRPTIIELTSQFVSIAGMIICAVFWKSIWALVLPGFLSAIVSVTMTHTMLPGTRDRLAWHKEYVKEIMDFGRWILASSALSVISSNADKLMLGYWLTQTQMGFYSIALSLAMAVEGVASRISSAVGMPAFSEIVRDDPARLANVFRRMRLPMDIVFILMSGILFACGPLIIESLYDSRYFPAGTILSVLSLSLMASRYTICFSVYSALGQTKYLAIINLVRLISIGVLMPAGHALFGVEGVYWAIALCPLTTVPVFWFFNRRHGLLSVGYEIAMFLMWPLAYGIGLAIDWGIRQLLA